jgi:hypothetical protein
VKQVKFVLEGRCSISHTAIATAVGISPPSVYCIPTNSLGKRKVCAKWIPHVLNDDQEPCVFFSPPPICSVEEIKAMHPSIAF